MRRLFVTSTVLLAVGAMGAHAQIAVDVSGSPTDVTGQAGYTYTPAISVGDPNGTPSVTSGGRVDANVSTSPFAGVVSVFIDSTAGGGLCTGTLISPNHILTAAHCFDADDNGQLDPGVNLGSSSIVFNHTGDFAAVVGVTAVEIHPDYDGFSTNVNDDLAILTLATAAPVGVPIYDLNTDPFVSNEAVILAGYGTTGDASAGYTASSASFTTKRAGQNLASSFFTDQFDEGDSSAREVWLFDFDGPDLSTSTLDGFGTFGNDIEVTIGGGDSGGPAFLWDDDGDTIVQADELTIFGTNTFTRGGGSIPDAPFFGSQGGGIVVSTYEPWIQTVIVPAPSTGMATLVGMVLLNVRRRRV